MTIFDRKDVVNGYTIEKLLGENPNRYSYLASKTLFDPSTGMPTIKSYTLKVVEIINPKVEQLLKIEGELLVDISSHPSSNKFIPIIHEYFIHTIVETIPDVPPRTIHYFVTVSDFINGKSLQEIILDQGNKGPFNSYTLLNIISQIAEAVDYIHSYGIAHQNIKPSNIILDSLDSRYKLIDLSSMCSSRVSNECPSNVGTVYYTPPELLVPGPPTDFSYRLSHDMWSLGVTFYTLSNLGQDYMNFTSHDPTQLSKEIQLLSVNPSRNSYQPINGIIAVLLNKNPIERPNSSQLCILIYNARPLCIVNETEYDRIEAKAALTSLGINIDLDTDDLSLCEVLTAFVDKCTIVNTDFSRGKLLELAGILGIDTKDSISSKNLCNLIKTGLTDKKDEYSKRVTKDIIRSLEFVSALNYKKRSEKVMELIKNLQKDYITTFTEAKKLDLIDIKLLEARRKEATHNAIVYAQTVNVDYAKMYAEFASRITQVILNVNPEANVNGVPLDAFQKNSLIL